MGGGIFECEAVVGGEVVFIFGDTRYFLKKLSHGNIYSAYDQLAAILAKTGPEEVMKLRATDEMQVRMELLLKKSRENILSIEEKDEPGHFIVLERPVRLALTRKKK